MTSREEIALQLTLKVVERVSFSDYNAVKTHPYEIYNSIYENIKTNDSEPVQVIS